jgi:hypothetical protein
MGLLYSAFAHTHQDGDPDQAFDKEKHKSGDAKAFEPFEARGLFFHSV